jgi:hypothetical protein
LAILYYSKNNKMLPDSQPFPPPVLFHDIKEGTGGGKTAMYLTECLPRRK